MMDFLLEAWVASIIEGKKVQWMLGKGQVTTGLAIRGPTYAQKRRFVSCVAS